jgi:NCAIR mutase (PurE)-related protein
MPWRIIADAVMRASGDNPALIILSAMFLSVLLIIVPLAVYIGKQWADQKKEESIIMKDIFSRQDESTKSIVAAQTASTASIIEAQNKMTEKMANAIISRINENHDESMAEFGRNERHIECIKGSVIEIKTAISSHDRRP